MKEKHKKGFTLVELMVTVAIVGIIASMAVPSFSKMIERNRLKEAIESLKSDLMFTRTEAIKRSANINMSIKINGSSWCYGIDVDNNTDNTDANDACDCTIVSPNSGSCIVKTVAGSQFTGTTLTADRNITFFFRRGSASNTNAILSTSNYSVKVIVSDIGRVRVCSPDSSKAMVGYDDC